MSSTKKIQNHSSKPLRVDTGQKCQYQHFGYSKSPFLTCAELLIRSRKVKERCKNGSTTSCTTMANIVGLGRMPGWREVRYFCYPSHFGFLEQSGSWMVTAITHTHTHSRFTALCPGLPG